MANGKDKDGNGKQFPQTNIPVAKPAAPQKPRDDLPVAKPVPGHDPKHIMDAPYELGASKPLPPHNFGIAPGTKPPHTSTATYDDMLDKKGEILRVGLEHTTEGGSINTITAGLLGQKAKQVTYYSAISGDKALSGDQAEQDKLRHSFEHILPTVDKVHGAIQTVIDRYNHFLTHRFALVTALSKDRNARTPAEIATAINKMEAGLDEASAVPRTLVHLRKNFKHLSDLKSILDRHIRGNAEPDAEVVKTLKALPENLHALQKTLTTLSNDTDTSKFPDGVRQEVENVLIGGHISKVFNEKVFSQLVRPVSESKAKATESLQNLTEYLQHANFTKREFLSREPLITGLRKEEEKYKDSVVPKQPQISTVQALLKQVVAAYNDHIIDKITARADLLPAVIQGNTKEEKMVNAMNKMKQALAQIKNPTPEHEAMREAYFHLFHVERTSAYLDKLKDIVDNHVVSNNEPKDKEIQPLLDALPSALAEGFKHLSALGWSHTKHLPAGLQEQMKNIRDASYIIREEILPFTAATIEDKGGKRGALKEHVTYAKHRERRLAEKDQQPPKAK